MQAATIGRKCQTAKWVGMLLDSFDALVREIIEFAQDQPYRVRIKMLENFVQVMCDDSQKPALFLEIATVLSKAGISALTTNDWDFVPALQAFSNCRWPIEEIRRLTGEVGDIYNQATVIENDVALHMATASALQAIKAGECFLELLIQTAMIL